jgi:hypothetical protein
MPTKKTVPGATQGWFDGFGQWISCHPHAGALRLTTGGHLLLTTGGFLTLV